MTRFDHTETAIDLICSTRAGVLARCPRCRSRRIGSRRSGEGWRLWTCRRCAWEANIPVGRGRQYARDVVALERDLAEVLRADRRTRLACCPDDAPRLCRNGWRGQADACPRHLPRRGVTRWER